MRGTHGELLPNDAIKALEESSFWGKKNATWKNFFKIVKPVYQGFIPHPKFPLPKARLITAGASANNLLNVSFAKPENPPSGLPAGLEPDSLHLTAASNMFFVVGE